MLRYKRHTHIDCDPWLKHATYAKKLPIIPAQFDDVYMCLNWFLAWSVCRTKNVNVQSDIANLSIMLSICYANIHIEFLFLPHTIIYLCFAVHIFTLPFRMIKEKSTEI